jgi:hypothetical protein
MSATLRPRGQRPVMLAVLLVAAVTLALIQTARTHAVADSTARLETACDIAATRVAALETELATMRGLVGETRRPSQAPHPPPAPAEGSPRGEFNVATLLAERPEWRSIHQASERAGHLLRYAAFFHFGALSSAEQQSVANELAEREERLARLRLTLRENQWAADDPRSAALQRSEDEGHAATLRALLGDARFRQFEEYSRLLPVHDLVGTLASRLYFTDTPLTRKAAEQLTRVLAQHASSPNGTVTPQAVRWQEAHADAGEFLAPRQLAELERLNDEKRLQREMNRIVARAARATQ